MAQRLGNLDVTSVSLALMYWHMAGVIEPSERNTFELRESLGDTNQGGAMREQKIHLFQLSWFFDKALHQMKIMKLSWEWRREILKTEKRTQKCSGMQVAHPTSLLSP